MKNTELFTSVLLYMNKDILTHPIFLFLIAVSSFPELCSFSYELEIK